MEKVNINRAEWKELQKIIHIGPVRANAIITARQDDGPFGDIYELSDVQGIGPVRVIDIADQGVAFVSQ